DGMVPKIFGLVSRRTGTPLAGTLIIGGLVAMTAALIPLGELADATSIGTLFAFFVVNLAVIYLRFKRPDLERSFKVPFGPVVPALGALACAFLMINLGGTTWAVFGAWMAVGALVYFAYSRRHSVVGALSESDYRPRDHACAARRGPVHTSCPVPLRPHRPGPRSAGLRVPHDQPLRNHLGGLRRVDGRRRSRLLRLQPPPLGRRRTQRVRLPHQRRRLSRPPVPRTPRRTYAAAALSPRVRRHGRSEERRVGKEWISRRA